jgi:hypothetical protein
VHVRLSPDDRALLDRLVEAVRKELGPGITVTDAGVLRWLLVREGRARGLASKADGGGATPAIKPKKA